MIPGERILNYILEKRIGEGGMGEVWLAKHAHLEKWVAVKAMAPGLDADPKFRERFLAEAKAMAVLQHPHIVGATDFFEEGGRCFLVMPFVDGTSLEDRIESLRGPLPVPEALSVAKGILGALDHAHRKGVIHRDVKPSNILIDMEGNPHLTDFGIALLVGDSRKTKTGFSVGTPSYMSPEQIERPKQVDHRTDVYSFGCVLFEMLCGRPPFLIPDADGDSDYIMKRAHATEVPPCPSALNPSVSPAIEAVILKALEKDPARRYQGCGEFARALGEARSIPQAAQEPRPVLPVSPPKGNPVVGRAVAPAGSVRTPTVPERLRTVQEPVASTAPRERGEEKSGKGPWIILATVLLVALSVLTFVLVRGGRDDEAAPTENQVAHPSEGEASVPKGGDAGQDAPRPSPFESERPNTPSGLDTAEPESLGAEPATETPGRFPEGSDRLLSPGELSSCTARDLKIMRNEIYARHGYRFKTEDMKAYFANQSWYVAKYDDMGIVSGMLSSTEKSNVSLIQRFEKR